MRNRNRPTRHTISLALLATTILVAPANGAVTTFSNDLAGFNAAAGNPDIQIDFDAIAPGTDITGQSIAGVTFVGPGSPLIVVPAASTFTPPNVFGGTPNPETNVLPATSGLNVLSPGGAELGTGNLQEDSLTLVFSSPVSAFGFDHLSQSADGFSFTSIAIFDADGNTLFSGTVPISGFSGGAPGGADFFGVVSSSPNIARIVITEDDRNTTFPDANIGFDTFRFAAIPEPAFVSLVLPMLVMLRRRTV
jgi:hypothetical protein